ncbi:hypothetical protein ILYODFUR_022266 [Ilyodon furcidens]|uniref:Uncharacterized protein n=1 Tax=Ilyodon furcidens TaxID=33524 RepID=A0ABV0TD59_9TELE
MRPVHVPEFCNKGVLMDLSTSPESRQRFSRPELHPSEPRRGFFRLPRSPPRLSSGFHRGSKPLRSHHGSKPSGSHHGSKPSWSHHGSKPLRFLCVVPTS